MLPFFSHPGVRFAMLIICAASFYLGPSAVARQETSGRSEMQAGVPALPASFSDFDVKIGHGKLLIRQKGSQKWRPCSEVNEPLAVGLLEGNHRIYLPTKAIVPPKPIHTEDPVAPHSLQISRFSAVLVHFVVDEHGAVRLPTVDASSGVEYTKATIEAVQKWTFEPAKLNGQAVAVLSVAQTTFTVMQ
jgi:hypothetical protein